MAEINLLERYPRSSRPLQDRKRHKLTAQTAMHVDDWKSLFDDVGYTHDYYWFIAQ